MNLLRFLVTAVLIGVSFGSNAAESSNHQMVMPALWLQWMTSSNQTDLARGYGYATGVIDSARTLIEQRDKEAKDGKDCATLLYDRMNRLEMPTFVIGRTKQTLDPTNDRNLAFMQQKPVAVTVEAGLVAYCLNWYTNMGK